MTPTSALGEGFITRKTSAAARERWLRAFFVTALVLSSLYVYAMWAIDTRPLMNVNGYEKARFVDMVYGKADKPFVYRMLVPTIVRAVRSAIPDAANYDAHGRIYARFPELYGGMLYLGWELEYLTEYATAVVLTYAALLGFCFALKGLARALFEMPAWLDGALPVMAVWALPVLFVKGTHYLYDFPQLLLFTLLLSSLVRRKMWAYYPLFVLGLLNKETTVLVTVVFYLHLRKELRPWPLVLHLALQAGLFLAVKACLAVHFAANVGTLVENHLRINLYNALLRPYDLAAVCSVAALALLVGWRWQAKPPILRQASLLAIPMCGLYFVLGTYGEIRVFYELFPVILLLCAQSLATMLGWKMRPRAQTLCQGVN